MRLIKFLVLLVLLFSNIVLLSGCWNYHDIEKYSIVAGMAIDKNEQSDKYLLTAEIIDFAMSGKEAKATSKFIESEGSTVFDAIRNCINITGKRLYWAHAKIVIISQDIAKDGIAPVLDLLNRDVEVREEMDVIISKEKTAKEVLEEKTVIEEPSSFGMDGMIVNQNSNAKCSKVQVYELVNMIEGEGISPTLPTFGLGVNNGKKTQVLLGTAVFKSDKLVGFLDTEESKYFVFTINKVDRGLLILYENRENKKNNITLEIFKSKTKVSPEYHNGKLVMNLNIGTEVAIAEIGTSVDYIDEKGREKLKKDAEEALKLSVEKVIKKVQNEYDSDIFGFGMITKADMPSLWKEIKPYWDNLFKTLDIHVSVDITVKNSASVSKTITKEE